MGGDGGRVGFTNKILALKSNPIMAANENRTKRVLYIA